MRIVLFFGKDDRLRHMELPVWALLALLFLLAAALAFVCSPLLAGSYGSGQDEALASARRETRALVERETRGQLRGLLPVLADLHFQVAQLDLQSGRLAGLIGAGARWQQGSVPEDADVVALRSAGLDEMRGEMDFITRQVELKTDALAMLELYLIEQQLAALRQSDYVLPVPASSRISSGYGLRPDPFSGLRAMHRGIDFEAREGTPVRVVTDGLVARVAALPDYGNLVEITHRDGRATRYAHLKESFVRQGQVVRKGEIIAQVGSTGRSTGPHLHFEVLELGVQVYPLTVFIPRTMAASLPAASLR